MQKTLQWPTNYAGKLGSSKFIHIDLAPAKPQPRHIIESYTITLITADGSHPPVNYRIADMVWLTPRQITTHITLKSHGLNMHDFTEMIWAKYHQQLPYRSLVLYFYEKI